MTRLDHGGVLAMYRGTKSSMTVSKASMVVAIKASTDGEPMIGLTDVA